MKFSVNFLELLMWLNIFLGNFRKQNLPPSKIVSNLVTYYMPTNKNISFRKIELKWIIISLIIKIFPVYTRDSFLVQINKPLTPFDKSTHFLVSIPH